MVVVEVKTTGNVWIVHQDETRGHCEEVAMV